ncbi:MAG: ribosomal protein [Actinomycetota bacterium]|jgi:small subunit ribosomal protein S16
MSHQLSGEIKLVAVKIKLKRMGSIRNPQYRVVIADARTARDGRAIEEIGLYHPKEEPSLIKINSDRVQYWLGVGAQPTEPVMVLLKITGDWQKFKGLPGAEGTLRVKEAKVDKNTKFAETVAAVANEPRTPTIRPKVEKPVEVVEEVKSEEAPAPSEEVAAPVVTEEVAVEAVETDVVAEAADAVIASDDIASEETSEAPAEEA